MMTDLVVCVPDQTVLTGLEIRAGVRYVLWDSLGQGEESMVDMLVPPDAVPGQVIARLPAFRNLRVIQTMSTGVDWIAEWAPPNVTLCSARGAHATAVAEWIVGAILAMELGIPGAVRAQIAGIWGSPVPTEVAGKRILILGAGTIGQAAARRLRALEAKVAIAGRHARGGVMAADAAVSRLARTEILVVVLPFDASTRHLVSRSWLSALPDNALVVNAGRGQTIDGQALRNEIVSGRLRAALDVTEPEPLPSDHPFWSCSRVFLSSHVAGNTAGSRNRVCRLIMHQIDRLAAGRVLANIIPPRMA